MFDSCGDLSDESFGEEFRCSKHPFLPAVARCVGCGRLVCAQCRNIWGGRNFCDECLQTVSIPTYPSPPLPGGYTQIKPSKDIPFPEAKWGYREALIIFVTSAAVAFVLSLLIRFALPSNLSSLDEKIVFLFFSSLSLYAFLLLGTFISVKRVHPMPFIALGISRQKNMKELFFGIAMGLPLFIAAVVTASITQYFIKPTKTDVLTESVTRISTGSISGWAIFLLVITLVVLAPICEEIFFRGYLYPIIRNKMPAGSAMLINGAIFAAAHFELVGFLPRMLLGLGLAYMYDKKRSLVSPVIGHALYNGLLLLLLGFLNL